MNLQQIDTHRAKQIVDRVNEQKNTAETLKNVAGAFLVLLIIMLAPFLEVWLDLAI